tara:strand:+ start:256 stop:741 length:486 start_codon:yes stop_codon:yes gene_type:complete
MARKSKAKFKMKGHTLPGINQRSETTNLKDGRSPSSAFQMNSDNSAMKNYRDMSEYSEPGDAVQFGDKDAPLKQETSRMTDVDNLETDPKAIRDLINKLNVKRIIDADGNVTYKGPQAKMALILERQADEAADVRRLRMDISDEDMLMKGAKKGVEMSGTK